MKNRGIYTPCNSHLEHGGWETSLSNSVSAYWKGFNCYRDLGSVKAILGGWAPRTSKWLVTPPIYTPLKRHLEGELSNTILRGTKTITMVINHSPTGTVLNLDWSYWNGDFSNWSSFLGSLAGMSCWHLGTIAYSYKYSKWISSSLVLSVELVSRKEIINQLSIRRWPHQWVNLSNL